MAQFYDDDPGLRVGGSTAMAQFYDDDLVLWFHRDNSVEGRRFHGDSLNPDDGSVEGRRFHGNDPDPVDT
jgi:hypothetical protein